MPINWIDDPYSEFLDLPPGDRPPHYYELLELEIFCAHHERIEHAVRKQFRKIKPYQDHPERKAREAIQDVLTRIAQARVVLTDSDAKEVYDRELAEKLGIDRHRILDSRMATPVPDFALAITAGPTGVGDTIELLTDATVTIGRDPHCVIPLHSLRAGMLHGELHYRDGRWSYTHLDKGRLTLINDARITGKELEENDRLEMGGYALRFRHIPRSSKPSPVGLEVRESQARGTPAPPPLTLVVTRGPSVPDAIFSALAPESVLIGECETALWQLAGPQVSRHHCRIVFEADHWTVVDLQSTNGTWVNGRRIPCSPIDDRDLLTIGSFEVLACLRK
ncbi:MAG: FHA domain-containing protein [Planctomycetota bacterium]